MVLSVHLTQFSKGICQIQRFNKQMENQISLNYLPILPTSTPCQLTKPFQAYLDRLLQGGLSALYFLL